VPDWPAPAAVRAFISTRRGGVSRGPYAELNLGASVGDDAHAVAENRARMRAYLPSEPCWLRQVHGNRVIEARASGAAPEADASIAREINTVLVIQVADCMPVLLTDRAGSVIGAAHAGWRGLADGVIENTVRRMDVTPESLLAYLGPAIGPNYFEVGSEVREVFCKHDMQAEAHFHAKSNGKWLADLYGLARRRLGALGVGEIYGGGFCTVAEAERFFSFRRDGVTGRMAAFLWLADPYLRDLTGTV
jgi:YfiH family protein